MMGAVSGPDYIVEIGGASGAATRPVAGENRPTRPWLAVLWRCCHTYSRVYRNPAGTGYHGSCPRCGRPVSVKIGPGGTRSRFFEAI